eukprot:767417-Hanusia_phi.AAC.4
MFNERTKNLRNRETNGKVRGHLGQSVMSHHVSLEQKFNIITGALYEYCNPSMDEKVWCSCFYLAHNIAQKPSGISTVDTRSREIHPSLNPGPPPAHLTWADS